jgi:hypothetical protein
MMERNHCAGCCGNSECCDNCVSSVSHDLNTLQLAHDESRPVAPILLAAACCDRGVLAVCTMRGSDQMKGVNEIASRPRSGRSIAVQV